VTRAGADREVTLMLAHHSDEDLFWQVEVFRVEMAQDTGRGFDEVGDLIDQVGVAVDVDPAVRGLSQSGGRGHDACAALDRVDDDSRGLEYWEIVVGGREIERRCSGLAVASGAAARYQCAGGDRKDLVAE